MIPVKVHMTLLPTSQTYYPGMNAVKFRCQGNSEDRNKSSIQWYRNNDPVVHGHGFSVSTKGDMSILTVYRVFILKHAWTENSNYSDQYTCKISNGITSKRYTVNLAIKLPNGHEQFQLNSGKSMTQ